MIGLKKDLREDPIAIEEMRKKSQHFIGTREATEMAHEINTHEKLDLALIACGGITLPEHFDQFLRTGADVATSATGMMWDPYLAAKYHSIHRN